MRRPSASDAQPLGRIPESRGRVLFVHADADMREVVTRVLEQEHYTVRAVNHSGHAVLLSRTTCFDLLLAELSGPDVSGPAMAAQLRRHSPGLAALYLAGPGTPEGLEQTLVRPFTRDDLIRRIDAALSNIPA